jgi:hypothetical protein
VRFFISSFLAVVGQAVTAKHAARLVRTALLFSAVTAVSAFTGLAAVATSWSSLAYSRAAAHGGPSAGFYLLMLVLQATVLIALGCIPLAYHWISSILLSRGAIPSIVKRYRSQALEFGYSVLEREAESRDIRVERVREGSGVLQVNPATAASGQ